MLAGAGLDNILLLVAGVLVAVLSVLVMRRYRALAVVVWVAVICFVPYWLGITAKAYFPPATVVALLIILSLIPLADLELHPVDGLLVILVICFAVALAGGSSGLSVGFTLMAEWIPAYIVGRLLASAVDIQWIYGVVAVAMTAVAVLALLEFASRYNYFIHLPPNQYMGSTDQYQIWGTLQSRGGQQRAEGAFGHSIALGASLALAIPLTIGSRFRTSIKVVMVALMLGASLVTFSRIGIVCCALGIVLCVVFLRDALSARVKVLALGVLALVTVAALPSVSGVFADAGAEASKSAAYRGNLVSLFATMNPLGLASSYQSSGTGDVRFSNFRSIDSEVVLMGLTHGLIPLALVMTALVGAIVVMLRGKATVATIAIVAQIPAWTSVALITQYATFTWFVAGVAVTSQQLRRRSQQRQDSPPAHQLGVGGAITPGPVRQTVSST